jgi:hypothetical protein
MKQETRAETREAYCKTRRNAAKRQEAGGICRQPRDRLWRRQNKRRHKVTPQCRRGMDVLFQSRCLILTLSGYLFCVSCYDGCVWVGVGCGFGFAQVASGGGEARISCNRVRGGVSVSQVSSVVVDAAAPPQGPRRMPCATAASAVCCLLPERMEVWNGWKGWNTHTADTHGSRAWEIGRSGHDRPVGNPRP